MSAETRGAAPLDAPSEEFSRRYERCFRRVFHYVSRRVSDWRSVDEIVASVLAENLELLAVEHGETQELTALKLSSDRELARRRAIAPHAASMNDPRGALRRDGPRAGVDAQSRSTPTTVRVPSRRT
jgi:hypothetical protein